MTSQLKNVVNFIKVFANLLNKKITIYNPYTENEYINCNATKKLSKTAKKRNLREEA